MKEANNYLSVESSEGNKCSYYSWITGKRCGASIPEGEVVCDKHKNGDRDD